MEEKLFFLAEQVFSGFFTPLGFSFIIQTNLWIKLTKFLYSLDERTFNLICLVNGVFWLPLGLFFVLTHNHWEMDFSIIVTLIGWLILIKCFFLLLYPQIIIKFRAIYGKEESFLRKYLKTCGVLYVLMGILVFM